MQRFTGTSFALLVSLLHPTLAQGKIYTVRSGDTLSGIAKREFSGPVYGKSGSLKKVIDLNADIKDPNRIYPAQKVILSPEDASVSVEENAPVSVEVAAVPLASNESSAVEAAQDATQEESHPSFGFALHGILSGTGVNVTARDRSYKTDLDSKLNKGLKLRGYYFINDHSMVGVELKALNTEFSDTSDGRFVGREKVLKEVSAFYQLSFASNWHFEIQAGSEQALFIAQDDADSFHFEAVFVDNVSLGLDYDLYKSSSIRWSLGLSTAYNSAAEARTVDVDPGYSYGAGTGLDYTLKTDTYLEAGLFYDRRIQDTDDAKQKTAETGVTLGLRLDY